MAREPIDITLYSGRVISATWKDKVFFDNEMLSVKDFLARFIAAVRKVKGTPESLRECWADMNQRREFLEVMNAIGFDSERLRDIQNNVGKADYDILDVMLDIAYDVEPVTREMRAQRAEAESRATLAGERMALFRVIVANYVRDGVWTLTAESFRDLLLQRYGSLGEAYGRLLFHSANEALAYYGTIQHALFAA